MATELALLIKAHDQFSGTLKDLGKQSDGLGGKLNALGKAAVVGAGVGLVALGGFLAASVKEALESQKVLAQLDAVLKSTGNAAGLTKDELVGFASEMQ